MSNATASSAQESLFQAYEDWRAWTESERQGILSGDWHKVQQCQNEKARLQDLIIRLTPDAQKETAEDGGAMEKHLRLIVDELILLETNNGAIIALQRAKAEEQEASLTKTSSNLRKIQRGYSAPRAAGWQSYS